MGTFGDKEPCARWVQKEASRAGRAAKPSSAGSRAAAQVGELQFTCPENPHRAQGSAHDTARGRLRPLAHLTAPLAPEGRHT